MPLVAKYTIYRDSNSQKFLLKKFFSQNYFHYKIYKIYSSAAIFTQISLVYTKITMKKLPILNLANITLLAENLFYFVYPFTNTGNINSKEIHWAVLYENESQTDTRTPLGVWNMLQQILHRPLQMVIMIISI